MKRIPQGTIKKTSTKMVHAVQSISHIVVGSTNPVKINAVTLAASETWPAVVVQGFAVASGVSEQPRGDEETRLGAQNRAKATFALAAKMPAYAKIDLSNVLAVGLEGGVVELTDGLYSTVWICVVDHTGALFESNGARFKVPEKIAQHIRQGGEMGPVVEKLVGENDVRSKQGMIGVITDGFVDRTEEYSSIAKMALGLWYGRAVVEVL